MAKSVFLIGVAGMLGACSTVSFAPPSVNTQQRALSGKQPACTPVAATEPTEIKRTVDGAMYLIDNFELAYRCAEKSLANGRRYFEVPAFLLGVAGIVGPSLGLTEDGKLVAGAGSSVLTAGNGYFAPKAKAGVLNAAHSAVVCIQAESASVDYFRRKEETEERIEDAERDLADATASLQAGLVGLETDKAQLMRQHVAELNATLDLLKATEAVYGAIQISGEVQYFQMVSSALLSVQSILSERLRDAGSADPKATFAELTDLSKKYEEAKKKLEAEKDKTDKAKGQAGFVESAAASELIKLENSALQPKLQTCVLQARH